MDRGCVPTSGAALQLPRRRSLGSGQRQSNRHQKEQSSSDEGADDRFHQNVAL